MKITTNFRHLSIARKYSDKNLKGLHLYFWHMSLSFRQAVKLFLWCICSILHGIFPFLFDFDLLTARINDLKNLKKTLPNDPVLQTIDFK
jgi:hypothetical protein